MSAEGVKCEDCGSLPSMASQAVANDHVLWMLICECGRYKNKREPCNSHYAAVREWESIGYRTCKTAAPNYNSAT